MAKPYAFAWVMMVLTAIGSVWGCVFVLQWTQALGADIAQAQSDTERLRADNGRLTRDLQGNQEAADRIEQFLKAWSPYLSPFGDKKDRQMAILNALEEEAVNLQDLQVHRKITPTIKKYRFGDQTMDVEQVQIVVSGPVSKALVFLGRAEELFPYARIKEWSFDPSENGKTIMLQFSLVQPVKTTVKGY